MSKAFRGLAGLVDDLEFGRGFVKENDKQLQLKPSPPIPNLAQRYAGRVVSPGVVPKVKNLALSYDDVGNYRHATALKTEPAPYMRSYQPIPDQYEGYTPSRSPSRGGPAEERRKRAVNDASMLARVQNLGPTPPPAPSTSATPVMVSETHMLSRAVNKAALSNKNMKLGSKKGKAIKKTPSAIVSAANPPPVPSSNAPLPHMPAVGFGGTGSAVAGALIGGTTAYMGSTQENRGFGTFMKGAAFGAGAGAVVSGIASRGMISGGAEWSNQLAKKLEFGEGFTENAISVTRGMETAQARGALFAAGAMLGGGMFGTNRNRAQGLNSTRGNRFGG